MARIREQPEQALLLCAAILFSGATVFFGFFYFSLYWPYRTLFNEEGRYFDENTLIVYHEQNGLLIIPALACLALALLFGVSWWIRRRAAYRLVRRSQR